MPPRRGAEGTTPEAEPMLRVARSSWMQKSPSSLNVGSNYMSGLCKAPMN